MWKQLASREKQTSNNITDGAVVAANKMTFRECVATVKKQIGMYRILFYGCESYKENKAI